MTYLPVSPEAASLGGAGAVEIVVLSEKEVRAIVAEAVTAALAGHGTPLLYTREQAARVLAVSESTLDELAREGRIPAVRHSPRAVRFRRSDLDAYVRRMETS